MNTTEYGYKASIKLYQHGRLEATSEINFNFGEHHSAKVDKKARGDASKIARDWIFENCRLSPITRKHIKKAGKWQYDLGCSTRRYQVRGGHVDLDLLHTFTDNPKKEVS